MIKLNKTTHLMILFTFAVVFVVVYLYYTINDVKRLNTEVKKLSTDVTKLTQDLQSVVGTMSNFNKDVMDMKAGNVNNLLVKQQAAATAPQHTPVAQKQSVVDDIDSEDDDDSSVTTEELKKIIVENDDDTTENNDGDGEVEDVPQSTQTPVSSHDTVDSTPQTSTPLNVDDLKKMKYDDLKDLCKTKGVSMKGTKDQIITRLTGSS